MSMRAFFAAMLALAMCGCNSSNDSTNNRDAAAPSPDGSASLDAGVDGSTVVSCAAYCDQVTADCSSNDPQYGSGETCQTECATFAEGTLGDSGNTVGCRQSRAARAAADPSQCPAAGPTGGGVCGTRCDAFCKSVFAVCVKANRDAVNPYASMNDCLTACGKMKFDPAAPEFDATNHDTLNCRQYYVQLAWSDTIGGSALQGCPKAAAKSSGCNK